MRVTMQITTLACKVPGFALYVCSDEDVMFVLSIQTCPGLEQYAIKKFAESLEALPRAIVVNSGISVSHVSWGTGTNGNG